MTTAMAAIRQLGPEDAEAWRAIRLEALKNAPIAFGQSYEDAASRPTEYFRQAVSGPDAIYAAFADDAPVGIAGFRLFDGHKTAHRGLLWGVYVTPAHRGTGLSRQLVEAVIAYAGARVAQLHLRVVTVNAGAYSLYRQLGFEPYGIEPRALRYQGRDYDETMMVRFLDRAR